MIHIYIYTWLLLVCTYYCITVFTCMNIYIHICLRSMSMIEVLENPPIDGKLCSLFGHGSELRPLLASLLRSSATKLGGPITPRSLQVFIGFRWVFHLVTWHTELGTLSSETDEFVLRKQPRSLLRKNWNWSRAAGLEIVDLFPLMAKQSSFFSLCLWFYMDIK